MAGKRLNTSIIIGGAIAGSFRSATAEAKKSLSQLAGATKSLTAQQKSLGAEIDTFTKMGKNADSLQKQYAGVTNQLNRVRAATERLRAVEKAREANLARRGQLRGQMVDTVALGMMAGAPIAAAVQFEDAMLGVAKQLDGARDSGGKLTKTYFDMRKDIQVLAREIPVSTNALAEMVTAGLRMGVARDEVLGFVKATSMMSTAFELPEGELAENMGKIAGLYKIPIGSITELADSINYLDDNAISKGGDIIEFLQRTGGVAGSIKVTGKEMAALGSTLLTMGESTETASTSVNAMFAKLSSATKGTKKFRSAMGEIGLSLDKVQAGMQTDALGTMLGLFERIKKQDPAKHMGLLVELFGQEHAPKLAKLISGTEELRKQIGLAHSDAAKGSMQKEFDARLASSSAKLQMTKNRAIELGVAMGNLLLPGLNSVLGVVGPMASRLADLAEKHPVVTKAVVGTTVALIALKVATLGSAYAWTFAKGGYLTAASALARMQAGAVLATGKIGGMGSIARQVGFTLLRTPWGLAFAGLVAAGVVVYREWDRVKSFFGGLWQGFVTGMAPVTERLTWLTGALPILGVAWDYVSGAVSKVVGWFSNLLTPVNHTNEQLAAAGNAGKTAGEWIAAGLTFALTPAMALIDAIKWISENFGGVVDKATRLWGATKSFFGVDEPQPAGMPAGAPLPAFGMAPPALPATASRSGGPVVTDNSQTTYQITQLPGENAEQLARRVAAEMEKQKQVRARARMTDGAYSQ